MAFTATPFANVFIDHTSFDEALKDDLFPHHYIYALSSPSNYVGADYFFGDSSALGSSALVDVTDGHDVFPPRHRSQLSVTQLPESLEEALRAFVVASAIRVARGDQRPRSMLVNVSRFKHVQEQVFQLVSLEFSAIKTAIEIHGQMPFLGEERHQVLVQLANTFNQYFARAGVDWVDAREKLFAAVYDTTVELVNSSRDKSADASPRNVIAVGGDVLSRGLTLDGLTVSYFYRQVGAADTLMQMARWFGYRSGYEDLVRVWIDPDVAEEFKYVGQISNELREQIGEMHDLGKTPEDFGLMVRKHPESLAITAKKGVAESRSMVISLSGHRIETTRLPASNNVLLQNDAAVRKFLGALDNELGLEGWANPRLGFPGKTHVSRMHIADLLEDFRFDRGNLIFANSLHKIIREQTSAAFQDWTVGIVGGEGAGLRLTPNFLLESSPQRFVRFTQGSSRGSFSVSGGSARLAGSTDIARTFRLGDLTDPVVYEHIPHPTLLIYPLEPKFKVKRANDPERAERETAAARDAWATAGLGLTRLMALAIAIPGEQGSKVGDVVYMLNGPAIEEFAEEFRVNQEDEADLDD